MAIVWGKSPLQRLKSFRARNWYPAEFVKFATKVANYYRDRNEIIYGIDPTAGTITRSSYGLTTTAGEVVLNGRHYLMAALSDADLAVTSGAVGQPIYTDGSTAVGIDITSGDEETVYASLIVCNSDGSGGLDSTDGGDAIFVLVVLGDEDDGYTDGTTVTTATYPTAIQVSSALEASTVHDGGEAASSAPEAKEVSWAYVCDLKFVEGGDGTITTTLTKNRNNAVQGH